MTEKKKCHDCGAEEGALHEFGCDMERCPFCGRQLISCGCCYKLLNYKYDFSLPMSGLPKDIYENGLSEKEEAEFKIMCMYKGRIPYIRWPILCSYCGVLWPKFFQVPNSEWQAYIQLDMRDKVVCRSCYDEIKEMVDNHDN